MLRYKTLEKSFRGSKSSQCGEDEVAVQKVEVIMIGVSSIQEAGGVRT